MEPSIQYDPRTKQQIKELLHSYLYEPVERDSKAKLTKLILRNSSLMGNSKTAFTYKGIVHSIDGDSSYRNVNKLHRHLYPEMTDYLKEVELINTTELPYVLGLINRVLNSSNAISDYMTLLPSSIHEPLRKFVATCPCRTCKLSAVEAQDFIKENKSAISLMKQRMVMNLLI